MIISLLASSEEAADFDHKIVEHFTMMDGTSEDINRERMQVAVRNSIGNVYRSFGVTGLDDYIDLVQFLERLGLTDELDGQLSQRHGYDNIFCG